MKKYPIKNKDKVPCKNCGTEVKLYKTTDRGFCCDECEREFTGSVKKFELKKTALAPSKNPINKVSEKRKGQNAEYWKKRKEYLNKPENAICFIEGCNAKANTVEHLRGRSGTNYLDESTWAPCCLKHNLELENNPELSRKYQLSKIHNGRKKE